MRFIVYFFFTLVLLEGCCKPDADRTDNTIAILGAFEEEIRVLENSLENKSELNVSGIRVTEGQLYGHSVVVAYTGIGKVNAAMSATLIISRFHVRKVIFTGIAGGIDPDLKPGDIVIGEKCVHHDLNYVYDDTLISYQIENPLTGKADPVFYYADTGLMRVAMTAKNSILLQSTNDRYIPQIITGTIATGDVFVVSEHKKEELIRRFGTDAVEMEGAAIAQICYQQGIACIIIRSISDSADKNAVADVETFYRIAAKNSGSFVMKMIQLSE
ncbi:MAG: 5'-methylthioadenosine/adenosylhomocysteine nucleosidase [Bacteroidales bacterium]|nr:5'-methylthioadenosine/adenosylhomocysteine nucleosidase [Bacteroidales bacterium]